jgi:hypothetical protein
MSLTSSVCEILNKISISSISINETTDSIYLSGSFDDNEYECIETLFSLFLPERAYDVITLMLDETRVQAEDYNAYTDKNQYLTSYELTFNKSLFIQKEFSGSGDVLEVLFLNASGFSSCSESLGLNSVFEESIVNNDKPVRIHVFGFDAAFGGNKFQVIPVDNTKENSSWSRTSNLPSSDRIMKQVHILSGYRIKLSPANFEINWGDMDSEYSIPFKNAYIKHLLVCLSSSFYSESKVQYKGIKHFDANISIPNDKVYSRKWISTLEECVEWCYSNDNPETPIQLLVDRLSLEDKKESIHLIKNKILESSLNQAKSNFSFVIASRNDEYRKELKDVYSDIQNVTDKYSKKSSDLSSELLKTLLTIGFVFTVGAFSKAIVSKDILYTTESEFLFKLIAVYLIFSLSVNWLSSSFDLKATEGSLRNWSKKLHNHISQSEVKNVIDKQVSGPKWFYRITLMVIVTVQLSIAYLAYFSTETFKLAGL